MSTKVFTTRFFVVAATVFIALLALNFVAYIHLKTNLPTGDQHWECGFPFKFYGRGGYTEISRFMPIGLFADCAFAVFTSVAIALMANKVFDRNRVLE